MNQFYFIVFVKGYQLKKLQWQRFLQTRNRNKLTKFAGNRIMHAPYPFIFSAIDQQLVQINEEIAIILQAKNFEHFVELDGELMARRIEQRCVEFFAKTGELFDKLDVSSISETSSLLAATNLLADMMKH